jgi:hypothetical protein
MWYLENETPFCAARKWVRDGNGALVWIVAVRASFTILPDGSVELSKEQSDPQLVPKYKGGPGESSLLYDSDLPLAKAGTDVLLHGSAYAPAGSVADHVDVSLRIGHLNKTLRVSGNRIWQRGLLGVEMSESQPFDRMPIEYERAFGGKAGLSAKTEGITWDRRNPIGTGFAITNEDALGARLPNIEKKTDLISSWRQHPEPAGFGPVAPNWSPRLELAGTYDELWQKDRFPLLPHDFSERFFQCAPADQQMKVFLKGGERVELTNLTAAGKLAFCLPRVAFGFETFVAHALVRHTANLHTVTIEPEMDRLSLVWHTALPCHSKAMRLERTVIRQKRYIDRTPMEQAS